MRENEPNIYYINKDRKQADACPDFALFFFKSVDSEFM